ncbi:DUF4873 domain-containing protein, partial [Rhodococcus sp. NPDC058514]
STGPRIARLLEHSGRHGVVVVVDESDRAAVTSCEFDEAADRWRVRTASGDVHRPRIVAAGLAVPALGRGGVSLEESMRDAVAYLGVSLAGFPNFFLITDRNAGQAAHHILACLKMMDSEAATRIEVRAGAQRDFNRIINRTPVGSLWRSRRRAVHGPRRNAFELSNLEEREDDAAYAGAARLSTTELALAVEVHLSGHFEPLDGNYHWYGRVAGDGLTELKRRGRSALHLTIPGGPETAATLGEQDPWGNYRITGVGAPPFPLERVEVVARSTSGTRAN